MDTNHLREAAIARGLTEHQADVAAALIPLVMGAANIERGIRAMMSHRQPGATPSAEWTGLTRQLDSMVGKASNAVAVELSRYVDALGLSLTVPAGYRLYDLMLNLSCLQPDDGERIGEVIHRLMEFCRTAPAAVRPHAFATAAKAGA